MKSVVLLGATGSIGASALTVMSQHPSLYQLLAVTAFNNVARMLVICQQYQPRYAVMVDAQAAQQLSLACQQQGLKTEVYAGTTALEDVAALPDADIVLAAIVGAVGLLPTLAAVKAGKRVLLANKEALVMAGALFMSAVAKAQACLMPIDSEHNALLQCMPANYQIGNTPVGVAQIILTASGGALRDTPLEDLANVSPSQACRHPTWSMGPKITIDSATMMNKGLEIIEASYLFNLPPDKIEVILHPQSIIHSLVSYVDGSFLAQLGHADMCIPIACGFAWPERITLDVPPLNFKQLAALNFDKLCEQRYPAVSLAYAALRSGGTAPAILNAANEIAVDAFLTGRINFTQIYPVIEHTLSSISREPVTDIEQVIDVDQQARRVATACLTNTR